MHHFDANDQSGDARYTTHFGASVTVEGSSVSISGLPPQGLTIQEAGDLIEALTLASWTAADRDWAFAALDRSHNVGVRA